MQSMKCSTYAWLIWRVRWGKSSHYLASDRHSFRSTHWTLVVLVWSSCSSILLPISTITLASWNLPLHTLDWVRNDFAHESPKSFVIHPLFVPRNFDQRNSRNKNDQHLKDEFLKSGTANCANDSSVHWKLDMFMNETSELKTTRVVHPEHLAYKTLIKL